MLTGRALLFQPYCTSRPNSSVAILVMQTSFDAPACLTVFRSQLKLFCLTWPFLTNSSTASVSEVLILRALENIIIIIFLTLVKTREGKKIKKSRKRSEVEN